MSNSTRCAACKYLRRRCSEDCVLAPYFPSSDPQRFECVHRIFGASNVSRMLQQLPLEQHRQAADAISTEANWRYHDPIYGSVGIINRLQFQIHVTQRELAETQAQIAMYNTTRRHHHHQYQQQQQRSHASDGENQYVVTHQQPSGDQNQMHGMDQTFSGFCLPPNFP